MKSLLVLALLFAMPALGHEEITENDAAKAIVRFAKTELAKPKSIAKFPGQKMDVGLVEKIQKGLVDIRITSQHNNAPNGDHYAVVEVYEYHQDGTIVPAFEVDESFKGSASNRTFMVDVLSSPPRVLGGLGAGLQPFEPKMKEKWAQ